MSAAIEQQLVPLDEIDAGQIVEVEVEAEVVIVIEKVEIDTVLDRVRQDGVN